MDRSLFCFDRGQMRLNCTVAGDPALMDMTNHKSGAMPSGCMRTLLCLLVTGTVIAFLLAAGCTGGSTPATVTPTPVPETPVVTATTPSCPAGMSTCPDGSCRNTTNDNQNCGGCGYVCPVTFVCLQSQCINSGTNVVATPYTPATTLVTPGLPPLPGSQ